MSPQSKQEILKAAEALALEATGIVEHFMERFPGFPDGEWKQLYEMSLPEDAGFGKVGTLHEAFTHLCRAADSAEVFFEWARTNLQETSEAQI